MLTYILGGLTHFIDNKLNLLTRHWIKLFTVKLLTTKHDNRLVTTE